MATATEILHTQMSFNSDAPARRIVATLGNPYQGKHLFELGTDKGRIEVHANTRTGAASKAKREGYEVRDVNMVG